MQILKTVGRIFNYIITALLVLLLLFNLTSILARKITGKSYAQVCGFTTAVVISGSMEPSISINDIVVIQEKKTYVTKDVITFVSERGSLITHHIVEITEEGYMTQGDANNSVDTEAPISKDKVLGKVIFVIPGIGLALEYMKTPLGLLCITLVGFVLLTISSWLGRRPQELQKGGSENHEKE